MIQYTRLQCKFPFCIMVYILSFLIDIVIINIPKFAFSILKMQYFIQAVQTRQPEHCAKQTNQRQCRKETICGQSPSSSVYLQKIESVCSIEPALSSFTTKVHSVRMNVDGNVIKVMSVRSGRDPCCSFQSS